MDEKLLKIARGKYRREQEGYNGKEEMSTWYVFEDDAFPIKHIEGVSPDELRDLAMEVYVKRNL